MLARRAAPQQPTKNPGYDPIALADLDFAFKIAGNSGLIDAGDPDIAACKAWFAANAGPINVFLGPDGLPTKQNAQGVRSALKPAESFERMAQSMPTEISRIAAALRAHGIWIWSDGAIEAHLGVRKNDPARISFVNTALQNQNLNHAVSPQTLIDLANWM